MLFESFGLMILNWLRIPPGTSVRKYSEQSNGSNGETQNLSDVVKAIVDITRDDVCFGRNPVFVQNSEIKGELKSKVDRIVVEFNDIIRWACWDILTVGWSVYLTKKNRNGNLVFLPVIGKVEFYMNSSKEVVLYIDDKRQPVSDYLIFLNYEKESLEKHEEGELIYKIKPIPVQLKNAIKAMNDLTLTENSILQYRRQLAKIVRIVNVDLGVSQGDTKDTVVDSISSAINANSSSLNYSTSSNDFDDSIPVVPNRKGIGRPEIMESIPSADIQSLADLDYDMNKLCLLLRFPKSYADFGNALSSQNIMSTIRGDIRYTRMIEYTRDLLITSMNRFLSQTPTLHDYKDIVSMAMLPTNEDEDILNSISGVTDYTDGFFQKVLGGESNEQCKKMLESFRTLLAGTTSFDYVSKFFDKVSELIDLKFPVEGETEQTDDETGMSGESEGPNFERSDEFGGPSFGGPSFGETSDESIGGAETADENTTEFFAPAE